MGRKTTRVVQKTIRFLSKAKVRGPRVVLRSKPLTVHAVKTVINGLLAEEGIIAPEDTIFAAGRKSSDPHYDGKGGDLIRAGEPIVFDIFPAEPDGYWHDCTRTYAFSSPQRKVKERLRKNSVVTIEPGLYDPKVGGVRIEDIVVVGSPSENLTNLPKDLQI